MVDAITDFLVHVTTDPLDAERERVVRHLLEVAGRSTAVDQLAAAGSLG